MLRLYALDAPPLTYPFPGDATHTSDLLNLYAVRLKTSELVYCFWPRAVLRSRVTNCTYVPISGARTLCGAVRCCACAPLARYPRAPGITFQTLQTFAATLHTCSAI